MQLKKSESTVLVPVNTWLGNAPELQVSGRNADVGAFAEALVYYDKVLLSVENYKQLYEILEWFKNVGETDAFLGLIERGEVQFYHYNFDCSPIYDSRYDAYHILNVQEEKRDRLELFRRHVVGPNIDRFYNTSQKRQKLFRTLEDGVVTVEANSFGKAINDARDIVLDPTLYAEMMNFLFKSLNEVGIIDQAIHLTAKRVAAPEGTQKIETNIDFKEISKIIGTRLKFGNHIPIWMALIINRLLWSASLQNCDLSVSSPMFDFLCKRVEDSFMHAKDVRGNLAKLSLEVEFPDVRSEVNSSLLDARKVLKIRDESYEFRQWFHKTTTHDRDIINAYANDIISKSNWIVRNRKSLRLAAVVLGPTIGAHLGGVEGAVVGSLTSEFLNQVIESYTKDWTPKIFGNSIKRISN